MDKNRNHSKSSSLIFGRHSVLCALNNPKRKIHNLFTTRETWDELEKTFPRLNFPVSKLDKRELEKLIPPLSNHQNLILDVEPLVQPDIEDLIEQEENKKFSCIVILDQVTDPHNIGAILRSAAAFNVSAVILPEYNSPKENNTIIKCASGAFEITPLISVTNINRTIMLLKQSGYWIIGLSGNTNNCLTNNILGEKIVFILGAEDKGIRKLIKENCDYLVKIPISNNVESLNVSNAAAICLHKFSNFVEGIL
jgi:23S rRNA (guanosine2251-2'-O)-methyltransferase